MRAVTKGEKSSFDIAYFSHKGMVRAANEDFIGIKTFPAEKRKRASLLAVLADGVGGHAGGEVASEMAVRSVLNYFDQPAARKSPADSLATALKTASESIFLHGLSETALDGMGTTAVCALITGRTLFGAHLGDSRLYLLRKRILYQLTRDHTWLAEIGGITLSQTEMESRSHPLAHVLSRYLGSPRPSPVDLDLLNPRENGEAERSLSLQRKDILLLCSDGLTDLVTEDIITRTILTCGSDLNRCARALVYHALQNGGHDNTSVVLIGIP